MTAADQSPKRIVRGWWLLPTATFVGLLLSLLPGTGVEPRGDALLVGAILIGVLANYPIPGQDDEASFAHAISLTLGLALGPGMMAMALAIGLTAGELVRAWIRSSPARRPGGLRERLRASSLAWSLHTISPLVALAAYQAAGGTYTAQTLAPPPLVPVIAGGAAFSISFVVLTWLNHRLLCTSRPTRAEVTILVLIAVLPVPFAAVAATAYAQMGLVALLVLGSAPAVVAPILRGQVLTESSLQRRLDEIATLSQVSQAVRAGLDLGGVLSTIYRQVAHLLHIDNFYIALYDPETDEISYPLAVKGGVRQDWPSRPRGDRLTDRVIQSGDALLLRENVDGALRSMRMPDTANAPSAWVGVPLRDSDRVIGCLAVFHTQEGQSLTQRDQELLETFAGQVAISIANAILYNQTRDRAEMLASLNEITAWMTSTLDPDRTLELVGLSILRVGGGQKSAIYLVDPQGENLVLARSISLSDHFIRESASIPLTNRERTECFHTAAPDIVADIEAAGFSDEHVMRLRAEGVKAYADFPLTTPDGVIGQLSVYFSEPQRFRAEQVELLRTLASQAALAVVNARLHAETDQALRRRVEQLAVLEAVGREMAATLEGERLFSTILEHAQQSTSAECCYLGLVSDDALRIVAQREDGDSHAEQGGRRADPGSESAMLRSAQTARTCSVTDVQAESIRLIGPNSRSGLCVPIMRQTHCMGVICVESLDTDAFSIEDERFLTQLANQAAVALANAGLVEQLEARLREQSLLYQASAQIAATLESEGVAQAATDSLLVALSASACAFSRWDPAGGRLRLQIALRDGLPIQDQLPNEILPQDVPALLDSIQRGTPVQWNTTNAPGEPEREYLLHARKARSLLAVPLIVGEELLGLIEALDQSDRVFDDAEVRSAQTIGAQAAIALQNTDLFQRISESYDRLMAVLNSTQEGMLMVDTAGRVVLANPRLETLTGVTPASLRGASIADPALDLAGRLGFTAGQVDSLVQALPSGHVPTTGIVRYELERPSPRFLQRTDTPVRDARGSLAGLLIVVRDVTEDRKLEESRRQLTEMIVHDLRSPLTAILSSLRVLEGATPQEARSPIAGQALTVSNRSIQRMLVLVNSLLDIAKLETGELRLSLKPVSVERLCAELLPPFVQEANEQGVFLSSEFAPAIPDVHADAEILERVLINLLDNALKFTPDGGSISLRAVESAGELHMSVSDTGPGVPPEFRDRIFVRFGQIPGISGRRHGTGLGLAFAKLAIEAHHGRIWVEDNPGGGSVFRFTLPLRRS